MGVAMCISALISNYIVALRFKVVPRPIYVTPPREFLIQLIFDILILPHVHSIDIKQDEMLYTIFGLTLYLCIVTGDVDRPNVCYTYKAANHQT